MSKPNPPHPSASPPSAFEIKRTSNSIDPAVDAQINPIPIPEETSESNRPAPLNQRKRRNSTHEHEPRSKGDEGKSSPDYTCPKCSGQFTRRFTLREHLRRHDNIRPFNCRECPKSFFSLKDRNRHELLHSGEKAFICEHFTEDGRRKGCGRRFARADGLSAHLRSDAGKLCCAGTMPGTARAEETQDNVEDGEIENFEVSNDMLCRRSSSVPIISTPLIEVFQPSESGTTTPKQTQTRVARPLDSEELLKRLGVGVDGYLHTIASQPADKPPSCSNGSDGEGSPASGGIWEGTRRKILFPVHKHEFPVIFETW